MLCFRQICTVCFASIYEHCKKCCLPDTGQPPIETSIAPIVTPLNPLAFGAPFGLVCIKSGMPCQTLGQVCASLRQVWASLGQVWVKSASSLRQVCVMTSLRQVCDSLGKSATVWAGATWPQLAQLVLQKNILAKVKISSFLQC